MGRPATASLTATICRSWLGRRPWRAPAVPLLPASDPLVNRRDQRATESPGARQAEAERSAAGPLEPRDAAHPAEDLALAAEQDLQAGSRDELLARHPARRCPTPPSSARAAQTPLNSDRLAVPHGALLEAENPILRRGSERTRSGVIADLDQPLHVESRTQTREDRVRLDWRWPGGDELNSHPRSFPRRVRPSQRTPGRSPHASAPTPDARSALWSPGVDDRVDLSPQPGQRHQRGSSPTRAAACAV